MLLDGLVRLYELSGGSLPSTQYFCNEAESDGSNVLFAGNSYTAFPIQSSSGWEKSLDGALPRPTIAVSNIFGTISALIENYDLRDCTVTRKIVPIKNLDNGSAPDVTAVLRTESYLVSRIEWNNQVAVVSLRSPIDVENLKIPRRTVGSLLS